MATQRDDGEQWERERQALLWLCQREGVKPTELARGAGLDHHQVLDVLAGKRRLYLGTAQKLCEAWGACLCLFDHAEGGLCPEHARDRREAQAELEAQKIFMEKARAKESPMPTQQKRGKRCKSDAQS